MRYIVLHRLRMLVKLDSLQACGYKPSLFWDGHYLLASQIVPTSQNPLDSVSTICYTQSMSKMGRPKKPAKERSSHLIALRLTPAEHQALEQAAAKSKLSVSNYIRIKLDLRGEK
jgi:hypothetical protein